jgi:hypothetical protein
MEEEQYYFQMKYTEDEVISPDVEESDEPYYNAYYDMVDAEKYMGTHLLDAVTMDEVIDFFREIKNEHGAR